MLAGDIESNPGPPRKSSRLNSCQSDPMDSGTFRDHGTKRLSRAFSNTEILDNIGDLDLGRGNEDDSASNQGGTPLRVDVPQEDKDSEETNRGESVVDPNNADNDNDFTVRVTCTSCNSIFRNRYRPFFCTEPGCISMSHRQEMCSGLSRTRQKEGIWRCFKHGGRDLRREQHNRDTHSQGECVECNKTLNAGISPIVCSGCPNLAHAVCTKLSRDQILKKRDGMISWYCSPCCDIQTNNTPSQPLEKSKCLMCKSTISRGKERMRCNKCKKESHKCCTGLTRDAYQALLKNDAWQCDKCAYTPPPGSDSIPTDKTKDGAGSKKSGKRRNVRGLQWNADGINTKMAELNSLVVELEVDVVLIQETKLTEKSRTPRLHGYTAVRQDRPNAEFPGGGLLTYVKDDIAFRKIGGAKNGSTEALSISIQQNVGKWLDITNLYSPPRSEERIIDWIPATKNCLIAGDFNGHSGIWDPFQPEDSMGSKIADYIVENDLICCNNGSPTRVSRVTGGLSAPDITLASKNLENAIEWNTINELGSDHIPIVFEIKNEKTKTIPTEKESTMKWKRKKVDWSAFEAEVEDKLDGTYRRKDNLHRRVANFNKILTNAGWTHVGKTQPKKKDPILNPDIRSAIKRRNNFRDEISSKRTEWIEACQEVNLKIAEAKEKSWIEFLDELEDDPDTAKVWRTIRSLSGNPDNPGPNEALLHNGKLITSPKKKADLFMSHYAKVSTLHLSKEDRKKKRELKTLIKKQGPEEEICKDFDIQELKKAIKNMKAKGASGPDDIPPTFLKNLGKVALNELLEIMNQSFHSGIVPKIWKHAIIIPILKNGKPASKMESFRPISLTSVIVKTLERMIINRLYYEAETKGWLSDKQAGFRARRSCEDQVLRMVQGVSDNFQEKPSKRTVMALIDYSKAYDRVWRVDLLLDLISLGCPMQMVRWFRMFLTERTGQVRYNGALSNKKIIPQGLPQGAVSSPVLFLIYINGLANIIPEDMGAALFADDASFWCAATDLNRANRRVQECMHKVVEWSEAKKMSINVEKSEITFFSNDPHEAKWRPSVNALEKEVPYNPNPKFLGVHLDRTLSFASHVKYVTDKVKSRNRMLASLSTKQWGWKKKPMKKVFTTMQRSVMDYAAAAWQPWLSKSQFQKLETAQNSALRIITGQYNSTPVEALRLETGIDSYATTSKRHTAKAYEKARRLEDNHPRSQALSSNVGPHRTKRRGSWRLEAESISRSLPLANFDREPFPDAVQRPWTSDNCFEEWTTKMEIEELRQPPQPNPNAGLFSCFDNRTPWDMPAPNNDPEAEKKNVITEAAIQTIDGYGKDTVIYTDGSCKDGTENGGAAAVITTGSARYPIELEVLKRKGAKFTCSYDEEKNAMNLALDWILENNRSSDTIICTDSLSLLTSIESRQSNVKDLIEKLQQLKGRTIIQWVPSHSNIPGNELADRYAKEIAQDGEPPVIPLSYNTARAIIKREIRDPPPSHPTISKTYEHLSFKEDRKIGSRKDAALLAQLRSGHCKELAAYQHRIDDSKDENCPKCQLEAETLQHWISCPATISKRQRIFGDDNISLGVMTKEPELVLAYAKETFHQ